VQCSLATPAERERSGRRPGRLTEPTIRPKTKGIAIMLWTILVILLALWLIGLVASIGGALIHLLLVLALIVFVAQIFTGRRSVCRKPDPARLRRCCP
jgi:4-hydroxybenzoate polyprenyltransferase